MTIGPISQENVRVFTETPHAQMPVAQAVADIRRRATRPLWYVRTLHDYDWASAVVLDAGCGAGFRGLQLALHGARVHGVDGSAAQVERARAHAEGLGVNATFTQGWLEQLSSIVRERGWPAPDVIINQANIHHVAGWREVIGQFSRVLKPGGYLVLSWEDPTLSLAGLIIKNQVAFRLGWNAESRRRIGTALFGWWDWRRNTMAIERTSYFADLYAAYYRAIPLGTMRRALANAGFAIVETSPPTTVAQWRLQHPTPGKALARLGRAGDALVRWRYFFQMRTCPRVLLCQLQSGSSADVTHAVPSL